MTLRRRGQASVVGVALLLAVTVVALGILTASIGGVVDSHVSRSDANRVADGFADALQPVEATGHHSGEVAFADGSLTTVERELRVLDSSGVVATREVGGLVFEAGDHRVEYVAGAILQQSGESTWTVQAPPVVASSDPGGVLVVGAPLTNASHQAVSGDQTAVTLETNVSHERVQYGDDTYRVAIETTMPRALETTLEEQGATVTRRDFDGDGIDSVVAEYSGTRTLYLVDHDMRLEVSNG